MCMNASDGLPVPCVRCPSSCRAVHACCARYHPAPDTTHTDTQTRQKRVRRHTHHRLRAPVYIFEQIWVGYTKLPSLTQMSISINAASILHPPMQQSVPCHAPDSAGRCRALRWCTLHSACPCSAARTCTDILHIMQPRLT